MYSTCRQSAFAGIFSVFLCLIVALPVFAEDLTSKEGHRIPLMEEILAQPFTVSVISRKYGVFNATLHMKNSLIFPERLHGEFVPIGQQQLDPKQWRLEHFSLSREWGAETPSTDFDAHPSLMSIDVHLDFSGANAGKLSIWTLPANAKELEERESGIESGEVVPTAKVSFSFLSSSPLMVSKGLSDAPYVARQSTGKVLLSDGSSGSFSMRSFTEHEFSISLNVNGDRIWVYGYALPNEEILPRAAKPQPWWHMWAAIGIASFVFVLQVLMAIVDTNRKIKLNDSAKKTLPVETKKNI